MGKAQVAEVPDHLQELAAELPLTLTQQQAANVLCVHERTLQRMVAEGEIRGVRRQLSGRSRVIIPRSEVIRWMREHSAR